MHVLVKPLSICALLAVPACSFNLPGGGAQPGARPAAHSPGADTVRPRARGIADFFRPRARPTDDGTGGATAVRGETRLGVTIASLGDPAEGGMWLKTALVDRQRDGRIVWKDNGNSVNVTLVPIEGDATSASRISLDAMRQLGVPLTALPEVLVFAR